MRRRSARRGSSRKKTEPSHFCPFFLLSHARTEPPLDFANCAAFRSNSSRPPLATPRLVLLFLPSTRQVHPDSRQQGRPAVTALAPVVEVIGPSSYCAGRRRSRTSLLEWRSRIRPGPLYPRVSAPLGLSPPEPTTISSEPNTTQKTSLMGENCPTFMLCSPTINFRYVTKPNSRRERRGRRKTRQRWGRCERGATAPRVEGEASDRDLEELAPPKFLGSTLDPGQGRPCYQLPLHPVQEVGAAKFTGRGWFPSHGCSQPHVCIDEQLDGTWTYIVLKFCSWSSNAN
jgi:hypothetical protein